MLNTSRSKFLDEYYSIRLKLKTKFDCSFDEDIQDHELEQVLSELLYENDLADLKLMALTFFYKSVLMEKECESLKEVNNYAGDWD